jgi:hypothetical protein
MRQPSLSLRATLVACALGAIAVPALAQTAHDDSVVSPAVASKQKSEIAKGDPQRWYRGDNTTQGRLAIQKKEIAAAYSEAKNACRKGQSAERKGCLADAGKAYRSDMAGAARLVAKGPSPEILEEVGPVDTSGGGGATAVGSSGAAGSTGAGGAESRNWSERREYRAAGTDTSQASQANNQAGPTGSQSNMYQSGPTGNQPGVRQSGPVGSGQMGQSGAAGSSQSGATSGMSQPAGTSQLGGTGVGNPGTTQSGATGTAAGQSGMGQSGAAGMPAGQPAPRGSTTSQPGAAGTGSSQSGATGSGSAPTEMNGSDATRPGAPPPDLPRTNQPQGQRY